VTAPVELSIHIEATPTTVFRYFVDPVRLLRWQGIEADLEPLPGGQYRVRVTPHDVAVGTYVEVVPDERVVFTWGWEGSTTVPPGSTTVEVTLAAEGGGTTVTLVHRDLPDAEAARSHERGWTHYLPRLATAATRAPILGPPPPSGSDPVSSSARSA
jgi:uncharacterized protein YndB with AHSA1/START domain